MERTLFGCRKERVSEKGASDYINALGTTLLSELGFSLERAQTHIAGGSTRIYRDAAGSEIEHFHTLITPDLQQAIPVHVNLFHVTSYPERVKEVRKDITRYSQDLGYVVREGLADSLSII